MGPLATPPPSAKLLALVGQGGAVRVRRPVRQLAIFVVVSLLAGAALVAWPARWIWGCALRPDLSLLPRAWVVGAGTLWLSAFVILAPLLLLPVRGQVLLRVRVLRLAPLVAWLTLAAVSLASPTVPGVSFVARDTGTAVSTALQCFAAALVFALGPVVIGLVFLRRAIPVGAVWVGAALGAAGGVLAGLCLHLHCPWAAPSHVLAGHVLPIAAAAVLTALLGRRALEP
jgi:hypothetical protein